MKKFGLIGGTGPESTILYYHDINYEVNRRTNGKAFPEFSLESINLCRALDYCKEEKYDELTEYLLCAVNNLAKSGAEFAALSANTLHIVFDSLKKQSPIPLVSIVDATCTEVKRRGFKKVGLLGTIFTMKGEFFSKPFIEQGIDIVTPSEKTMELVNDKITNQLELGIIKEETKKEFIDIIKDMQEKENIEAIILGCTELPLILNEDNCPIPCMDTLKIHINALADMILKEPLIN